MLFLIEGEIPFFKCKETREVLFFWTVIDFFNIKLTDKFTSQLPFSSLIYLKYEKRNLNLI